MSAECAHGLTADTCADCQRIPDHATPNLLADCRTCGAPIIWTVTTNGKRMPVDAEPNPAGNVVLQSQPEGPPLAVYTSGKAGAPPTFYDPGERHTSHFATCPESSEWRRS